MSQISERNLKLMSTRSQEELRANETSSHAGLQIEAAVTDENF